MFYIRMTGGKNLENIIATNLVVSVKVNARVATPTGDNRKTKKEKAMGHCIWPAMVAPTLASLKTAKNTATVTASGEVKKFITGNTRNEKEKDTDFISGQMETSTTVNGKKTREQE